LEIEERGKFKTYGYEFSSIDVFGRDDDLIFLDLDEFISSFFVKNPTFNRGSECRRLGWTWDSTSSGRNLSTRWFYHGTEFWEWEITLNGFLRVSKGGKWWWVYFFAWIV